MESQGKSPDMNIIMRNSNVKKGNLMILCHLVIKRETVVLPSMISLGIDLIDIINF